MAGIFSISVKNPQDFGVLKFSQQGQVIDILEKPRDFVSNKVVPGMYFFPSGLLERIGTLQKSSRGEYEIVELLKNFLRDDLLTLTELNRGTNWYDGGTVESLMQASNFVRTSQERLGQLVGSPHEAALNQGFIKGSELVKQIALNPQSPYWESISKIL
jgi:glucose-1-phosphate thymidylyltransferase